jgi:hypothetical protein
VEKVCVSEGLSQRGTRILMDAMASLRLLKKQGHRYGVTSEVMGLLLEGSPEYLGDFFAAVDRMFFSPFGRFEEAVRKGKAVWNVDEAGGISRYRRRGGGCWPGRCMVSAFPPPEPWPRLTP